MLRAKANKTKTAGNARIIDNPLFDTTTRRSSGSRPPAARTGKPKASGNGKLRAKRENIKASVDKLKDSTKYIMSTDEEKVSVFEIIADLEKQLDAAFSLKDSQEKEIQALKDKLAKIEEKAGTAEAKLSEMKGMLVSQEQINSELEFLENERLQTVEKIKETGKEIEAKSAMIKELENKVAVSGEEIGQRNKRIEQIENELASSNKTMQGLHNQLELLEDEKAETGEKLTLVQAELNDVIAERNRYKKELERARESLDEIRLTLADTRARAREHYYKGNRKG